MEVRAQKVVRGEDAPGQANYAQDTRMNKPQALILTIFGAFVRSYDNWLPAFLLTDLMSELQIDELATRQTLSRLKRRHVLRAETRRGFRGYSFTDSAMKACIANDKGIYERREPIEDQEWVLGAFSVPESHRRLRYQLRSQASRAGLAQVGAGLLIGPAHLKGVLMNLVDELEMQQYISIFESKYEAYEDLGVAVKSWWNIDALEQNYVEFLEAFKPLKKKYLKERVIDSRAAFIDYIRLLNSWRFLPIGDPGLPQRYLPQGWVGNKAANLFYSVHDKLEPIAANYLDELLPKNLKRKAD